MDQRDRMDRSFEGDGDRAPQQPASLQPPEEDPFLPEAQDPLPPPSEEPNVFTPIPVAQRLRDAAKQRPQQAPQPHGGATPMLRPGQRYGFGFTQEEAPPLPLPQEPPAEGPAFTGNTATDLQHYQQSYWAHLQSVASPPPQDAAPTDWGEEPPLDPAPGLAFINPQLGDGYDALWGGPIPPADPMIPLEQAHDAWNSEVPTEAWPEEEALSPVEYLEPLPEEPLGAYEYYAPAAQPGDFEMDAPMAEPRGLEQEASRPYEGSPEESPEINSPSAVAAPAPASMPVDGDTAPYQPLHPEPEPAQAAPLPTQPIPQEEKAPANPAATPFQERIAQRMVQSLQGSPEGPRVHPAKAIITVVVIILLVVCGVEVGKIVVSLLQNEAEMKAAREEYYATSGMELSRDANRVELLPQGETFAPTGTPQPVATLTATPVIPMGQYTDSSPEDSPQQAQPGEASPLPTAQRTKATKYEDNPLNNILEPFDSLQKENPDIVAQLTIAGLVEETVVQRNNTYYLTHNAKGTMSDTGAVFVDEGFQLRKPPENLLLRGQGTSQGALLGPLWRYQQGGAAFVQQHALIQLNTLYEKAQYVVFAVIVAESDPSSPAYFNYGAYSTFQSDRQMESYVAAAKQHSIYEIPVEVQAADRLLTIATLGEGADTTAMVLMARMLRPGETAASLSTALSGIREY